MAKRIKLDPKVIIMVASLGVMRCVESRVKRRANTYTADQGKLWQLNIEGVLGEYAAAIALDIAPLGLGVFRAVDLGHEIEVRTRSRDEYDLIVHPEDRDDARFLLVTGRYGTYDVHGWVTGAEAKQTRFWKDPAGGRPAFFVPQSELHPLDDLIIRRGAA